MDTAVVKKSRSEKTKPLEFSCRAPAAVPKPQRQGLIRRQEEFVDPRFNREVAGEFVSSSFGKAFAFLDEYREEEKREIASRIKSKGTGRQERTDLEKALGRMQSQDQARQRITQETDIRKELLNKELEAVAKTGKKAYFHPRSAIRKIMHERRDEELRKSGKLERFRAKEEKRKNSTARKYSSMPRTRRVVEHTE